MTPEQQQAQARAYAHMVEQAKRLKADTGIIEAAIIDASECSPEHARSPEQ
jgi:hypothetical protein